MKKTLLAALIILLSTGALAHGINAGEPTEIRVNSLELAFSTRPAFPMAGQPVQLALAVAKDGQPVTGARVQAEIHAHATSYTKKAVPREKTPGTYSFKQTLPAPGAFEVHYTIHADAATLEHAFTVQADTVGLLDAFPLALNGLLVLFMLHGIHRDRKKKKGGM